MAVTPGTEKTLEAAQLWFHTSFLEGKSVFTGEPIWSPETVSELDEFFVRRPDRTRRGFLEKIEEQLQPASSDAKLLAAEMLWVMMLFPSNLRRSTKLILLETVWSWSGRVFRDDHDLMRPEVMRGIGSGGTAYNVFRPDELSFVVRLLQARHQDSRDLQHAVSVGWEFAQWLDTVPGARDRQFRHMLLHLLFPESFERISSGTQKRHIVSVLSHLVDSKKDRFLWDYPELVRLDRRLWHIRQALEEKYPGQLIDFYEPPVWELWRGRESEQVIEVREAISYDPANVGRRAIERVVAIDQERMTESGLLTASSEMDLVQAEDPDELPLTPYTEPTFEVIRDRIAARGIRVSAPLLRSYHLALKTPRRFVILTGVSGTGKSWLAEAYAEAAEAHYRIMPVAPNWNTNEDLLGFLSPLNGKYYDTDLSLFLREAARQYERAQAEGVEPRPYHVILDEMNLARIEHYFARFLSAMEVRARHGHSEIPLAAGTAVLLPRNVALIGTVNVDETTQSFADKVYDRAQVIEMETPRDALAEHVANQPYAGTVLAVWDALAGTAPFAFRVLDEISSYHAHGTELGATWEELIDDQILQKILPKIRGSNPGLADALARLEEITQPVLRRSHAKVVRMREAFDRDGVISFHT